MRVNGNHADRIKHQKMEDTLNRESEPRDYDIELS